jgi:phage terminase large subunit-like protein
MCLMTHRGFEGAGSPDRVDALVWALTDLMLDWTPSARPGVRSL